MGILIDVLIPTVTGREDYLRSAVESYHRNSVCEVRVTTVLDLPCVGTGWNRAAAEVEHRGEYVHFTNDDITAEPGWDIAAIEAVGRGSLPAPAIYDGNGQFHDYPGLITSFTRDWQPVQMSTLLFMPWALWDKAGPCLDVHYYSDDYLSLRARQEGWSTVYRRTYAFKHHYAQVRRGAGMSEADRVAHDRAIYNEATGANRA